ncbi:SprT family protein [Vagococcus luciliae]|uniref:Protein SprT-like protein n=1 Tax=Vagococcus luciliae TaxID=2920380 RepID=A0ABY5NWW0_9ENTE|nr:SprT family protein [Vagococcus luciliae]UUV97926.1 Protein SprT-like protein [Vagococcus luciliae]
MNDDELQSLVEKTSLMYFGKPFLHQASFNKRLKTTGGRYHLASHQLDFNPKILVVYDERVLIGIIKHELCHYHLHLENKGYQHKDKEFKELLKQVDGLRFTPPLCEKKQSKLYMIECCQCHKQFQRKKHLNLAKYRCQCGGKLIYLTK